jgi:hypothetical protein
MRIVAVAEEFGYVVSPAASRLATGRTGIVPEKETLPREETLVRGA